ncbi:MAG TPA: rhomboid family intramembrane serine protease [Chloroflexia bacterium]|nr:rhomboid family intramembrane serine protease [Chloroflexia bacterium]
MYSVPPPSASGEPARYAPGEAPPSSYDAAPPRPAVASPAYVPPPVPPLGVVAPPQQWLRIPGVRPRITFVLLGILIILWVPMILSPQVAEFMVSRFALMKGPMIDGEWWRLITATFLHSPEIILHIVFNGYALFMIGIDLESLFGRARFVAIYAVSALGGSVASFAFSPAFGRAPGGGIAEVTGVGASGAIFGLIGALAVYFGLHRAMFGKMGQAQFWNIIIVIALNIFIGFSGFFPIDNSAHIGGLLAGAITGFILVPRYRLGRWLNPLVRDVDDINTGPLIWVATALVALAIIAGYVIALLLFRQDESLMMMLERLRDLR